MESFGPAPRAGVAVVPRVSAAAELSWQLPALTRAHHIALPDRGWDTPAAVRELAGERIGTALRRLAEDLVAERRRVVHLERENRELRAQIEALRRSAFENGDDSTSGPVASSDAPRRA